MRADLVLATPVSRRRFAASHLTIAFAGSVALLAVAGLATGLSYGFAGGGMQNAPGLFVAALAYAPAMWIMVGLAIALDGLVPRWVGVSWAILVACILEGFLGAVLGLPRWLSDFSPFERVPQLPAAGLTLLPLVVMSAVAAGPLGDLGQASPDLPVRSLLKADHVLAPIPAPFLVAEESPVGILDEIRHEIIRRGNTDAIARPGSVIHITEARATVLGQQLHGLPVRKAARIAPRRDLDRTIPAMGAEDQESLRSQPLPEPLQEARRMGRASRREPLALERNRSRFRRSGARVAFAQPLRVCTGQYPTGAPAKGAGIRPIPPSPAIL